MKRIDVHNRPPAYLAAMREQIIAAIDTDPTRPAVESRPRDRRWTRAASRHDHACSHYRRPGSGCSMTRRRCAESARRSNEYAAGFVLQCGLRIVRGVLVPDVEGSLAEATYALDRREADGIALPRATRRNTPATRPVQAALRGTRPAQSRRLRPSDVTAMLHGSLAARPPAATARVYVRRDARDHKLALCGDASSAFPEFKFITTPPSPAR